MERRYETIWIVRAELGAPGIKEIQERAVQAIEKGRGHVNRVDEWGVRRFAYPIQKKNEGFYTLLDFNAEPAAVTDMEKIFKYNEDVVRYQTVRLDEEYVEPAVEPVAEPAAETTEETTAEAAPAGQTPAATEGAGPAPESAETEVTEVKEESEEKGEEGPTDAAE